MGKQNHCSLGCTCEPRPHACSKCMTKVVKLEKVVTELAELMRSALSGMHAAKTLIAGIARGSLTEGFPKSGNARF